MKMNYSFNAVKYSALLLFLLGTVHIGRAQSPLRSGKDYAVFFYVTDFEPGLRDLPDTKTEAIELAKELSDNYNFTCFPVPECSKTRIENELIAWNERLQPGDQVLFFFSMHGYYDRNSDRGYLIPADGKSDDQNNYFRSWLSYDDLRTYLAPCKAAHILVGLDACYSGSFGIRSNRTTPDGPAYNEKTDCATKVRQVMEHKGRQFITAGKVDQTTPGKSVFVQEILKVLRTGYNQDGMLPIDDLAHRLHKLKSPEPEDGTFVGHKGGGDFVFVRKNACINQVPTLDRDGDGIPNEEEKCPDAFGTKANGGCPDNGTVNTSTDTDYDGIPDARDGCPTQYGTAKANGCPDRDNDGVPDISDKCPDKAGEPHWQGCPDTDGDGIPDHEDQCPSQRGLPADKGCPPPDRDGDGVPDVADKCPDKAGKAYLQGCPEKEEDMPDDGLLLVNGGTFTMGSPTSEADRRNSETQHPVTLSDFYIGKHEVTQKLWTQVMGSNPSNFKNCDNCPVEQVSWDEVQDFLKKLNASLPAGRKPYRLPTEAEWEYAARGGGKAVLFGNGKNIVDPKAVNFNGSASYKKSYSIAGEERQKTVPVGSLNSPNALGLHDMSGNVREWCSDWYGDYPSGSQTNPTGPSSGSYRVLRGGSWYYYPQSCRVAFRDYVSPGDRYDDLGFRLARTK